MEGGLDQLAAVDPMHSLMILRLADYLMAGPATRQEDTQLLAQVLSGLRQIMHAARAGMISREDSISQGNRLFERLETEASIHC